MCLHTCVGLSRWIYYLSKFSVLFKHLRHQCSEVSFIPRKHRNPPNTKVTNVISKCANCKLSNDTSKYLQTSVVPHSCEAHQRTESWYGSPGSAVTIPQMGADKSSSSSRRRRRSENRVNPELKGSSKLGRVKKRILRCPLSAPVCSWYLIMFGADRRRPSRNLRVEVTEGDTQTG